jgi:hypothetical protein
MATVKELRLSFWNGFNDHLKKMDSFLEPKEKPLKEQWHTIYLPSREEKFPGVHIEVIANNNGNRVELYFNGSRENNKRRFLLLEKACRSRSQKEFGKIEWNLMTDNDISKVQLVSEVFKLRDTQTWQEQYKWLRESAEAMQKFFVDYLHKIYEREHA